MNLTYSTWSVSKAKREPNVAVRWENVVWLDGEVAVHYCIWLGSDLNQPARVRLTVAVSGAHSAFSPVSLPSGQLDRDALAQALNEGTEANLFESLLSAQDVQDEVLAPLEDRVVEAAREAGDSQAWLAGDEQQVMSTLRGVSDRLATTLAR